jgi:aminoglycoside phosphotransferase (APT) family kinase protein
MTMHGSDEPSEREAATVRAMAAEVYGAGCATCRHIGWGNNQIWEIQHADGRDYLKRYMAGRDCYLREAWALEMLKGRVPVPKVRLAREDDGAGCPILLTRGVSGVPLDKVEAGRVPLVARMGTALAGLHNIADEFGPLPPFLRPQPGPRLDDAAPLLDAEVAGLIDLERLRAAMTRLAQPRRPVVAHRDFGDWQCLVAEGEIVAIVDWEATSISDPEADLAFAGAFLRAFRVSDEESAFLGAYQEAGRNRPDLVLYEDLIQGFLLALHVLWRGRGQAFEAGRAKRALLDSAGGAG